MKVRGINCSPELSLMQSKTCAAVSRIERSEKSLHCKSIVLINKLGESVRLAPGSPAKEARDGGKISAKRAWNIRCSRSINLTPVSDQGMTLFASKARFPVWHRGLRCLPSSRTPKWWISKTSYQYSSLQHDPSIKKTRNIGIIAHIDAVSTSYLTLSLGENLNDNLKGKTTTTERMLYYSGLTRRIGGTTFT